jgi:hypothetical protein
LSLAQIKKWHNGSLLVLRRVALKNFFNSLLVVLVEFKRNAGIVLRCVTMLYYIEMVKTMVELILATNATEADGR